MYGEAIGFILPTHYNNIISWFEKVSMHFSFKQSTTTSHFCNWLQLFKIFHFTQLIYLILYRNADGKVSVDEGIENVDKTKL